MPTISQLASDTVPNDNDLLVTVDVAAGTTKNITREDFFTGAPLPAGSVDEQAIVDTGWVPITSLEPEWENSGLGGGVPAVRKVAGLVYFKGGVKRSSGNITSGTNTVATLPVGFRPADTTYFSLRSNGGDQISTLVESTGRIRTDSSAANTPAGLDYVMFGSMTYIAAD